MYVGKYVERRKKNRQEKVECVKDGESWRKRGKERKVRKRERESRTQEEWGV